MDFADDDMVTQLILLAVGLFGCLGLGYLLTRMMGRIEAAEPDPMTDPVHGTLLVTAMSAPDDEDATWRNGWIAGVVTIDGRASYAVRRPGMFLGAKWPQIGQSVPVVVDRADERWLNILWHDEAGSDGAPYPGFRAQADQAAATHHIRLQRAHGRDDDGGGSVVRLH